MITNDYSHIEALAGAAFRPRLSVAVVIPFYKDLEVLQRTFACLSNQDYPRDLIEVVLAEDGGCDDTQPAIKEFLRYSDVKRVWISRRGFRLASVRNLGIRVAQAEVVILLDFDVLVKKNFLSEHMRWHHVTKNCVTFGLRRFVDVSGVSPTSILQGNLSLDDLPSVASISNRLHSIDKRLPELGFVKQHPYPCNLCHGCNLGFRRDMAVNAGLFDEAFNGNSGYEDIEFAARMRSLGCYVIHAAGTQVCHQENDVVGYQTRQHGMLHNLPKLYSRVPGLQAFRESLTEYKLMLSTNA